MRDNNNVWKLISLFLIGVMVGVGMTKLDLYIRTGMGSANTVAQQNQVNDQKPVENKEEEKPAPSVVMPTKIASDGHFYMGEDNAPVTIMEFGDYACGYCRKFYQTTLPSIVDKYVKTGKVKFIFRDYPLREDPEMGNAVSCAGDLGKFWEMHGLFFNRSSEIGNNVFGAAINFGKELGLNTEILGKCISEGKYNEKVKVDVVEGVKVGIDGVPGFLINNQLIKGYRSVADFSALIDKELAIK